jgi:hypothetical protein
MFSAALWVAHASSRVGDDVLPFADFSRALNLERNWRLSGKLVPRRRRNQHARRVRSQLFARPTALAADSGAASVSHGLSEWALVWVLVKAWMAGS